MFVARGGSFSFPSMWESPSSKKLQSLCRRRFSSLKAQEGQNVTQSILIASVVRRGYAANAKGITLTLPMTKDSFVYVGSKLD